MLVIFSVAGYYGYLWYAKPTVENLGVQDMANENSRVSEAQLYFFSADWCPHCKTAKPKMAEVQKNLAKNNNKVNGNTVQIELVNCEGSEEERNLAKNNDVKAYPTIVATKNGSKIAEYENNITVDNLEKWISEHA